MEQGWIAWLDSVERAEELQPARLLGNGSIRPGMTVVDVGCGAGLFTIPAAEIVGTTGFVYALDIRPDVLKVLRDKSPPPQVLPILMRSSSFPVPTSSADRVLLISVLHCVRSVIEILAESLRVLKPRGEVVIVDWNESELLESGRERGGPAHPPGVTQRDTSLVPASPREVISALIGIGFEVETFSSVSRWRYLIRARLPRKKDPPGIRDKPIPRAHAMVLPFELCASLSARCTRKYRDIHEDGESRERKAFGLLTGRLDGGALAIASHEPLRRNMRMHSPFRERMDEVVRAHGIPSETPDALRGWVADAAEVHRIFQAAWERQQDVLATYHTHRVPWPDDPWRDTPTQLDRILAEESGLWVVIASLAVPGEVILRAFFEADPAQEIPIWVESRVHNRPQSDSNPV